MSTEDHQSWGLAAPRRAGEPDGRLGTPQGKNRPRNRLAEDTGPFYNEQSLRRWLNVSGKDLEGQIADGRILACLTSDNHRVFPVWQFDKEGDVLAGIAEVISIFRGVGSPVGWALAKWLNVPNPDLGNERASALLARGEVAAVVEAAHHSVSPMTQ